MWISSQSLSQFVKELIAPRLPTNCEEFLGLYFYTHNCEGFSLYVDLMSLVIGLDTGITAWGGGGVVLLFYRKSVQDSRRNYGELSIFRSFDSNSA